MISETHVIVLFPSHAPTIHAKVGSLRTWQLEDACSLIDMGLNGLSMDTLPTGKGVDLGIGIEETMADQHDSTASVHRQSFCIQECLVPGNIAPEPPHGLIGISISKSRFISSNSMEYE